jgi:hypothetical protein
LKLLRHRSIVIWLIVSAMLVFGVANAQEGGKSLADLKEKAQKIKVGETTEAEVISLLGNPSKIKEGMKTRGSGREIRDEKRFFYGPNHDVGVRIDQSTGKVYRIDIR